VESYAESLAIKTPVDSEPPRCLCGEIHTKSISSQPVSLKSRRLCEQKAAQSAIKINCFSKNNISKNVRIKCCLCFFYLMPLFEMILLVAFNDLIESG